MQRDPEQTEVQYLTQFTDFDNAHILEIGTGDGRLTYRYAHMTRCVTAIDPVAGHLVNALAVQPPALRDTVTFSCSYAERLPFASGTFDGAILAWSL